jgi:hypothetical protein
MHNAMSDRVYLAEEASTRGVSTTRPEAFEQPAYGFGMIWHLALIPRQRDIPRRQVEHCWTANALDHAAEHGVQGLWCVAGDLKEPEFQGGTAAVEDEHAHGHRCLEASLST